jgi:hypothetical protein
MAIKLLLVLSVIAVCAWAHGQTADSFHPGAIWPDDHGVHINAHGGGILFQNGVYYWFGEHKIAGSAGNTAHVGVHCYSSTDLYNWKEKGIALSVSDDPASDLAKGCILERPKVLFNAKTRKYVMWFHLELKGHGYSAARCGVAVSDNVTGPYTYVKSFRPDAGVWPLNATEQDKQGVLARDFAGGQMSRDMTLFQDDDGKAYLICASEDNFVTHICELTDDYLGTTGQYIRAFDWKSEAPAIFKYQNKYFYIGSGCSGWKPNAAMSAVADSMLGPWQSLGNPCRGTPDQCRKTFNSQSTDVLPVADRPGAFIFMADQWRPNNAIDGRYIWLPIQFEDGKPVIRWRPEWDLHVFEAKSTSAN